ncbi:MAG: hypothetical protein ACREFO_09945 [Acetobacteraceae bacterium]
MHGGPAIRPNSSDLERAHHGVAESAAALEGFLVKVEQLGAELLASTQTLERREAVTVADEAAGLISLAADALRSGAARLARLEEGDLFLELAVVAAAARAEWRR